MAAKAAPSKKDKASLSSAGSSSSVSSTSSAKTPKAEGSNNSTNSSSSSKRKADIDGGRRSSKDEPKRNKTKSVETKVSAEGTVYAALAKLKDTDPSKQGELFIQKLKECRRLHNFKDPEAELPDKEGKRQTLVELLEWVNPKSSSTLWHEEAILTEIVETVGCNLYRTLTKRQRIPTDMLDVDEEEPPFDPAWPHLEPIYEMLQRVVSTKDIDPSLMGRVLSASFTERLVELFDAEDPRERECVKSICSRIQARIQPLRSPLRRAIQHSLVMGTSDGAVHMGVGEMLDVLVRFIGAFSIPLKEDHRQVLFKILLPLHKAEWLAVFHEKLLECTKKLCEKEPPLAEQVISFLLRCWPFRMASKQMLFLSEIDDMISITTPQSLKTVYPKLAKRLADCLSCINSDVAEKALLMWKSDKFMRFMVTNCKEHMPDIISALYNNATQHWHHTVHTRTLEVLKLLLDRDPELFDASSAKHRKSCEEMEKKETLRTRRWAKLQMMHDKKQLVTQTHKSPTNTQSVLPELNKAARSRPPSTVATIAPQTPASNVAQNESPSPRIPDTYRESRRAPERVDSAERPLSPRSPRQKAAASSSAAAGATAQHQQGGASSSGQNAITRSASSTSPRLQGSKGTFLDRERYAVGVSWENGPELDLQCVVVDYRGRIIEAVHELSPVVAGALARRSGQLAVPDLGEAQSGTIWLNLSCLGRGVALVVFLVCSRGKKLQELKGGNVHVAEESRDKEIARFPLENLVGATAVVAIIRHGGEKSWSLHRSAETSKTGKHFMDVVDTSLTKVIREAVPNFPKKQKALVTICGLARGAVASLPLPSPSKWLFVGVSWDLQPASSSGSTSASSPQNGHKDKESKEALDKAVGHICTPEDGLVVGLVFLDSAGKLLGSVMPQSPEGFGARHGGRSWLGQGLIVDFSSIPQEAVQVFVVVFLISSTVDKLDPFQRPHCCIVDPAGCELMRYKVVHGNDLVGAKGFFVGRFFRYGELGGVSQDAARWGFQALGAPCTTGTTVEATLPALQQLFGQPLTAFQTPQCVAPDAGVPRVVSL